MKDYELLSDYLDDALDAENRARVEAQVAGDDDALRYVAGQRRLDRALRSLLRPEDEHARVRQSILATVQGASLAGIKARVLETTTVREPRVSILGTLFKFPQPRGHIAWLVGLAAAAAVVLGLWLWLPQPAGPLTALARLAEVRGRIVVGRAGRALEVGEGFVLRPGDVLSVGDRASATAVYPDATRLEFSAGARAAFGDDQRAGKQIELAAGTLSARVSKQPANSPMVVRTPHASATVIGTRFVLRVEPARTRLEVEEGLVRLTRTSDSRSADVAAGQFAEAGNNVDLVAGPLRQERAPTAELSARDPAFWPFVADSPWNHPVGSGALFVEHTSPVLDLSAGGTINRRGQGRPVFVAKPGDPVRRIFKRSVVEPLATLRIPANAMPDDSPYAFLNLIDKEHCFVYEMNGVGRREDGDIEASQCFRVDLRGAGVPPEQMGANVSGIPSLAGTIRKGELAAGIRHALACIVLQAVLNRNGPNGHAFVWPAGIAPTDPKWTRMLSATGNLHLGTLLAIPPSVDIAAIGVGDSGPAFEIARALQDYGVYISGAFEGKLFPKAEKKPHIGFWIEPTATEELPENIDAQLAPIIRHLKVIANNGPASIGGGGVPRRPLAPNFTEGAR